MWIIPHLNIIAKDIIPQVINKISRIEEHKLKPKTTYLKQLTTKKATLSIIKIKTINIQQTNIKTKVIILLSLTTIK